MRHRADGSFGAERGTEDGQVSELQMQPVGGNPEKVPPSKGGPDGNQKEADEKGFGRRGGRIRNTALHPDDKRQRQRQALPPLGRGRGGGKGTDYGKLQAGLKARKARDAGHPGHGKTKSVPRCPVRKVTLQRGRSEAQHGVAKMAGRILCGRGVLEQNAGRAQF